MTGRRIGEQDRRSYWLVVGGDVGPEWAAWFGAEQVQPAAGGTALLLRVVDQAELQGVLRRVHDLHLPILSLAPATAEGGEGRS